MPWKKVNVPVTNDTAFKTKAIISFLRSEGHSVSRIHTTGIPDPKTGRLRRTNARKGVFDIVACIQTKFGIGLYFAWDQKTGTDILSTQQIEYMDEVNAAGGYAAAGNGMEDFLKHYAIIKKKFIDGH